jgi:hypothetical protein
MEAVTWVALGLVSAFALWSILHVGAKIDTLADRMDSRFDQLDARFDAMFAKWDSRLEKDRLIS